MQMQSQRFSNRELPSICEWQLPSKELKGSKVTGSLKRKLLNMAEQSDHYGGPSLAWQAIIAFPSCLMLSAFEGRPDCQWQAMTLLLDKGYISDEMRVERAEAVCCA